MEQVNPDTAMPINEANATNPKANGEHNFTNPTTSHPKAAAAQPSTSNPAPPAYTSNTPPRPPRPSPY